MILFWAMALRFLFSSENAGLPTIWLAPMLLIGLAAIIVVDVLIVRWAWKRVKS